MLVNILHHPFEVADEPADFWGWVSQGSYDHEWRELLAHLRPEHTFLDLGAWIGGHSLLASTVARQVLSIEPDPVAFEILKANFKSGQFFRLAIMGYEGTVTLGSGALGQSTTRANPKASDVIGPWLPGQQFDVACMTLRDFAANIPDPLFIKIDVEGAEEQILADEDFFAERKPTLHLETHPFWWSEPAKTWRHIDRIAKLYGMAPPKRGPRILMVGQ